MKKVRLFVTAMVVVSMLAGCGASGDGSGSRKSNSGGQAAEGGYLLEENTADGYYTANEAPAAGMTADMADGMWAAEMAEPGEEPDWNTEEYNALEEPGFKSVKNSPVSTFSADVDTASYTNLRRMIEADYSIEDIPAGAVRIEELLNYFNYDYQLPRNGEPFGVTTVIGECPWNEDARLLQIGLKTEEIDFSEAPASNLVFLLDVSGSMNSDDKLPLLQSAFTMLVDELTEKDRVSVVTYAGSDRVLLEGEKGSSKTKITEVINNLQAGGSTNGSAGIETAYRLAEENFIEGGNNRIILATDGDLNVGTTSESDLKELVAEKRESGIYLSVLGFGTGNLKDNKMETLADNGNGNYAYIDSRAEARKVMVEEMGATLVTVAKDVKLQVEFNPAYIKGYRLLGYENRILATEDFDDDTKDAGEIGAGHTVTALYEIIPTDSKQEIPETDLKYQAGTSGIENGEWATLRIRYKDPADDGESILEEYVMNEDVYTTQPGEDFYFAAAVAEFGLLVRDSNYKGTSSFKGIESLLAKADTDADDYRDEFAYLVKKLKRNSPAPTGSSDGEGTAVTRTAENQGDGSPEQDEMICGLPLAPISLENAESVECEWQDKKISLKIPVGWESEAEAYGDEAAGRFGVRFRPVGCSGWAGLYFCESFGVCGVGLVEQDITFDSGLSGRMGIFDDGDTWSFIVFPKESGTPGTFVALSDGAADWLAEHEDEVLGILGTAVMEDGSR
ncbi:MAG: VWA domain-containing protein [Butyrivibrio sp.]|nr:VWA domain-containing protein [Acetatifactor muris]MCM1557933.1 VWA domain-containing protein [Butyrivibrio sp.]